MNILPSMRSRRFLLLAYLLFIASMLLPTFAIDLGGNHNPIQPGYKLFLGGSVAALGIIVEPGGDMSNRVLGIYYFVTWLANLALLLPFLSRISLKLRRLLGGLSAVLAWSIVGSFVVLDDSLIRDVGIGYYLWSLSITLIVLYLAALVSVFNRDMGG